MIYPVRIKCKLNYKLAVRLGLLVMSPDYPAEAPLRNTLSAL